MEQTDIRITGSTLHGADRCIFISRGLLFQVRNVSDESCMESHNTYYTIRNIFSPENRAVYKIIAKILYSQTGHRWQYEMTHKTHELRYG
jgi:hypothetical protein